jgi:hypothetical protein
LSIDSSNYNKHANTEARTIFNNYPLSLQAIELCSYFKSLGATNLDEQAHSEEDLGKIVAVANLCFKVRVGTKFI